MPTAGSSAARTTHPAWFLVLYLPFGVAGGYVTVTLAYLLARNGLSVGQIAALVALQYVPQTWKVLWAPLVDTTLSARHWYVIGALGTGLCLIVFALVPSQSAQLWLLDVLALVSSITSSVAAMATESLMAHGTAEHQKGRAGGWSQAGSLGGQGLGGGAGLWMAQHVAQWSAGGVLGASCAVCCLALLGVAALPERARAHRYVDSLRTVGREVWAIARSRRGLLVLILLFLPIGTGAASNLWSAVANDWHADADTVALVNGVLSGLLSAAGCLVGGYLCDVMDRKSAYALFGALLAGCAVAMAVATRTPLSFSIFVCLYAFVTGLLWAAFSAVTLETIGHGAAATKYNLLASLSNTPITYMTLVDGWAHTRWGAAAMLFTEASVGLAGILLYLAIAQALRRGSGLTTYAAPNT